MSDNIHYIAFDSDAEFEHLHIPITTRELPADEIVLIQTEERDLNYENYLQWLHEAFEDAGIQVTPETFGRWSLLDDGFEEIHNYAYSQLYTHVREGNKVYINISSGPVFFGYAFIYATYTLLLESTQSTTGGGFVADVDPSQVRDSVQFYETSGHSYFGDILNSLRSFSMLLATLETNAERQAELLDMLKEQEALREDLLDILLELTENDSMNQPRWEAVTAGLDELKPNRGASPATFEDSIAQFSKGFQQIFDGLNQFSAGLATLSNDQLRTDIITAPNLTTLPHHRQTIALLKEINNISGEIHEDSEEINILQVLGREAEEFRTVLDELNFRQQDIEQLVKRKHTDARLYDEIVEYGFSSGATKYPTDQRYQELPIPASGTVQDIESAVVITLYSRGTADSISELINELLWMTLEVTRDQSQEEVSDSQLKQLNELQEKLDKNESYPLRDELVYSLRSKVQYHLTQLADKGFIQKEKTGRSNRIKITQRGILWVRSHQFDNSQDMQKQSIEPFFESLKQDIIQEIEV